MAHSTSGAPSERNATSASNHTSVSADQQISSPRPRRAFPLRFLAGALAHWQIIASAVLLGGGVAGLAATYDNYCGMTELSYAPAALRSDFEQGAKVSGFRAGVMAAQIETESHWRVGVVSSQGAKGIAQFTDEAWNAEHYSFGNGGNVLNPHDAIAAQARYLAELRTRLAKYASSEDQLQDVVLAGYNAGPGSVEKYGGVPPFEETQNYVKSIRELSNSKYKLTCAPEYQFKQAKLKFVNGVTPAMAGVHADGAALSPEESASATAEASTSASATASARPPASGSAGSSVKPSATSSSR